MKLKRLASFGLDYWLMLLITYLPFLMVRFELVFDYFYFILIVVFILTLLKDLPFKNASLGKKIFHLQIVDKNNNIPNTSILIIRNLTLLIWPIELIILLLKNKRIGDMLTKTKIIEMQK